MSGLYAACCVDTKCFQVRCCPLILGGGSDAYMLAWAHFAGSYILSYTLHPQLQLASPTPSAIPCVLSYTLYPQLCSDAVNLVVMQTAQQLVHACQSVSPG